MTTRPPRVPAAWLARIARVLFSAGVLALRPVYPAAADLQHEVSSEPRSRDRARARLRGYWAFWKLVCLAPFAFNHVATGDRPARGFWPVAALVLVAMILFVGWRPFMNEQFAWLVSGVPEDVIEELGRFSRFSFFSPDRWPLSRCFSRPGGASVSGSRRSPCCHCCP